MNDHLGNPNEIRSTQKSSVTWTDSHTDPPSFPQTNAVHWAKVALFFLRNRVHSRCIKAQIARSESAPSALLDFSRSPIFFVGGAARLSYLPMMDDSSIERKHGKRFLGMTSVFPIQRERWRIENGRNTFRQFHTDPDDYRLPNFENPRTRPIFQRWSLFLPFFLFFFPSLLLRIADGRKEGLPLLCREE